MNEGHRNDILPIGPLMIEHRLIERVVALLGEEAKKMRGEKHISMGFFSFAIDFFTFYADHCHHGKEENFLFKALEQKDLTAQDKAMLENLKQDHVRGRQIVSKLAADIDGYYSLKEGRDGLIKPIVQDIDDLSGLYEGHIRKEDKQFFMPVMKYLSKKEQDDMLYEFREFDRKLIHEKYKNMIIKLEGGEGI